jgi:Ca-activated chloride channel family protein
VRTTRLEVVARIVDGVASTTLRQTLHNDGARPAEATFLLPLPEGAVADDFRMTVGGVETAGEVLDATKARGVYESIVRRRRDPGLLEYYGRGCLRASVFPIPPHGDVVVEATYRELLPVAGELFRWSFPLGAGGVDGRKPERLILDLGLRTTRVLGSVLAPDRTIDVVKKGEHEAAASLELDGGALPDELTLFFGLAGGDLGLSLASTRPGSVAGPADDGNLGRAGTFALLVAPRLAADGPPAPRSIVFVLDTSGSMEGAKLAQARSALKGFLASLNPGDRFNVVPFSTAARPFFPAIT